MTVLCRLGPSLLGGFRGDGLTLFCRKGLRSGSPPDLATFRTFRARQFLSDLAGCNPHDVDSVPDHVGRTFLTLGALRH
jgi:hypothetical protein